MTLELRGVSKTVEGHTHIYPTDLTLEKGTMNVLLGPTLSGKTSLMRLMAGLDAPNTGQVFWNGDNVTGQRVLDRLERAGIQGDIGPKLNEERDAEYWFAQPGAPYAKLENEDEEPQTVSYDELIASWQ